MTPKNNKAYASIDDAFNFQDVFTFFVQKIMVTKHSEESEKAIEQYLVNECRERGWLSLKFDPPGSKGWPDRIVLPGNGYAFFVELKSKGAPLRPMQSVRLSRLREGLSHVYVCDSKEQVAAALRIESKCVEAYAPQWHDLTVGRIECVHFGKASK